MTPTLVFNAGSSSLKFSLFAEGSEQASKAGTVDLQKGDAAGYPEAVASIAASLRTDSLLTDTPLLVGHRVVHGGTTLLESVRIDDSIKTEIDRLSELAPLHNPPALEVINAAQKALPAAAHVAVFDTAFFKSLSPEQYIYPLPYSWYADWGIRRFGFHGISHAYCLQRAAELLQRDPTSLNLVSCHLGNGCSATATRNGQAIATTMGFTPLDGIAMGTRPGSLDPGILTFVQRKHGLGAEDLERILNHESGLMGISGLSADLRTLQMKSKEGHKRAQLALTIFATRVRSAIGALAVTLGKVDALVFAGGIGEHADEMRAQICTGLECLGITIDPIKNQADPVDMDIAKPGSTAAVFVIHTQEELMIAREARRVSGM